MYYRKDVLIFYILHFLKLVPTFQREDGMFKIYYEHR